MSASPFPEGGSSCGVHHRDGRAKTVGTCRPDFVPSSQGLLNEIGRPALMVPPGSRLRFGKPPLDPPSRNLLSFCSLFTRGWAGKDPPSQPDVGMAARHVGADDFSANAAR